VTDRPTDRLDADALELLRAIAVRTEAARWLEGEGAKAVLRSVVEATVALFDAEAASIALYDASADRLVFEVAAGLQGQGVVGVSIAPDQGIAGYVYTTGQSLALADVEHDRRFGRKTAEQTGYVPRSMVAVPLADERGTIGVLEVLDKRNQAAFTLRDIELAAVFARQAAIAISASRVERDTAVLLRSALAALAGQAAGDGAAGTAAVESLVAAATADLGRDDDSRLWELAERIARVRRADPAQLELVVDLLDALARHAERGKIRRRSR
jgi:signal transduction protein with GAF and PtsI domain